MVTWQYSAFNMCLRPNNPPLTSSTPSFSRNGSFRVQPGLCFWEIGPDTICKISSWVEGQQLEGTTMRFVREKHHENPVPDVIYEWVGLAWNRSFLMRRAPGMNLLDAWHQMTPDDWAGLADEIAYIPFSRNHRQARRIFERPDWFRRLVTISTQPPALEIVHTSSLHARNTQKTASVTVRD